MKKYDILKSKTLLFLVVAILVLCIGFFIVGCGTGPANKAFDPDTNNFALDFTDCPVAQCLVSFETPGFDSTLFEGRPLTFEAWVKPKGTSTGTILHHIESARGAALMYTGVTATTVRPKFRIIRAITSITPTSTATYEVTAASTIALNTWSHIVGILTNNNHTGVAGHPACAGVGANVSAIDDPWHMDIYINGVISACSYTYGGNTASAVLDPTLPADAYAHEPVGHTSGPGSFRGVIDEARIWNVDDRTISDCMNQKLVIGGTCNMDSANLISYFAFNEGSGHTVYDRSGNLSTGGKEYGDPVIAGDWLNWNTGWTTDQPF